MTIIDLASATCLLNSFHTSFYGIRLGVGLKRKVEPAGGLAEASTDSAMGSRKAHVPRGV